MNTPASLVVNKIVEDRINFLFNLLKIHPIHNIWKLYKDTYGIEILTSDLQKIYTAWNKDQQYALSTQIEAAEKAECWKGVEARIRKQTNKDVADFIYHHWQQYQKEIKK